MLKNEVMKLLVGQFNKEKLNTAYLLYGQKDLMRPKLLEKVLLKAKQEITQDKVKAFWEHMISFLPKCINLEII